MQDIQKAGAVFDIERLNFVNQAHIAKMRSNSLMQEVEIFNKKNGFSLSDHHAGDYLLELCKGSANNLSEISLFIKPFLIDFDDYNPEDFNKHLANAKLVIEYFKTNLKKLDDWSEESIENIISNAKNDLNLPMPKIGLPLRVALLGRAKSPQLNSTIYLIEKEKVIDRLGRSLEVIAEC